MRLFTVLLLVSACHAAPQAIVPETDVTIAIHKLDVIESDIKEVIVQRDQCRFDLQVCTVQQKAAGWAFICDFPDGGFSYEHAGLEEQDGGQLVAGFDIDGEVHCRVAVYR